MPLTPAAPARLLVRRIELDLQLDAAVGLAAGRRGVVGERAGRPVAGGRQQLSVDVVGALDVAGDGGGARRRQLPVVAEARRADAAVVGVPLDAHRLAQR